MAREDLGVTIKIPPGAVAAGEAVDLTVRPCLNGQFILPEGYKPASPVYLITASTDFLQDVQVSIEHFADLRSKSDCDDDNIVFLSASTTPVYGTNGPRYQFVRIPSEKYIFRDGQSVGTVALRHFCFITVAIGQGKIWASYLCSSRQYNFRIILSHHFCIHAGESVYSLLLYSSLSPSLEQNKAVFCITPCHPLYPKVCNCETPSTCDVSVLIVSILLFIFMQNVLADLKELLPDVRLWPSEIARVHLSSNVVSLDIPSDISGWCVDPDRTPEV